ncbi:MAG: SGNH/GDSL hydrolase family protein [Acutalibacteraceae bacterium]
MTVGKRILCFIIAALLLCTAIVFSFLYSNGLSGLHANIQHSDGQIKVACVGDRIEQINEANDVIRQTAADRGLELIDINGLTSQHPEWFVNDGVHPNADGAAEIGKKIAEFILK